jgi:soluble lytic murein transglycosylase-like protein
LQRFQNDRARGRELALLSAPPLTGFLALALLMLSLMAMQPQRLRTPALTSPVMLSLRAAADMADKMVKPQPPSEFAKEAAMSSSELMQRWDPLIEAAAKRFSIPEKWLRAVMRQETGGRTMLAEGVKIVSPVGAMGLMQLMPGTYKEMRAEHNLGADPYNPEDNIAAAAAYLRWLHAKFGVSGMFAAYNAGPGRVQQGGALPSETQNYVKGISRSLGVAVAVAGNTRKRGARRARAVTPLQLARYRRILQTIPLPPSPASQAALLMPAVGRTLNVEHVSVTPTSPSASTEVARAY